MKSWKLTNTKEYTLFNAESEDITSENEKSSSYAKVKLLKANLSPVDIACYNGSCELKSPLTPSRSAVALISQDNSLNYELGQRVFLSPYITASKTSPKVKGYDADGYLSDYTYVELNNIYPIPEGVSDSEVLFTEDIALCISCFNKLNLEKGQYIALYGASYLNCIFAQIAIYYQTVPVIIDKDEERLNIAQNLGIYYTIDSTKENVERKSIEITSGDMFDALIVDGDNFPNIDDYIDIVADGGIISVYGYSKTDIKLSADMTTVVQKGLTIIGTNNGAGEIHSAINLLANKAVKIDYLVEDETPFSNFVTVIKFIADKGNPFKHIITFE